MGNARRARIGFLGPLSVLLVLALVGFGPAPGAAAAAKVLIKFPHNQQTITPPHKAAEMFKQTVEQRTQGYYDVQIYPAQQLGGLRDQVEGTALGTIEVTQQTPATVSLLVPKVMILDFPFLWTSEGAMWKVLDGPTCQELA